MRLSRESPEHAQAFVAPLFKGDASAAVLNLLGEVIRD